jgi:hypothetical protein
MNTLCLNLMMGHGITNHNLNNRSRKKMDDKELFELAEEIDNFFNKTILEKELSVNGFNGVFMARMVRLNQACDNMENFNRLLREVADGDLTKENEKVLQ